MLAWPQYRNGADHVAGAAGSQTSPCCFLLGRHTVGEVSMGITSRMVNVLDLNRQAKRCAKNIIYLKGIGYR